MSGSIPLAGPSEAISAKAVTGLICLKLLRIRSVQRFSGIVKQAGADIILANHTDWDRSKINLPMLAHREPGSPNPYIVGNAKAVNFLKVAEECATARVMGANYYPTVNRCRRCLGVSNSSTKATA